MSFFEYVIILWLSINSLAFVLLYRKYRNIQDELEVDGYDSFFGDQQFIESYKIYGLDNYDYQR